MKKNKIVLLSTLSPIVEHVISELEFSKKLVCVTNMCSLRVEFMLYSEYYDCVGATDGWGSVRTINNIGDAVKEYNAL